MQGVVPDYADEEAIATALMLTGGNAREFRKQIDSLLFASSQLSGTVNKAPYNQRFGDSNA